MNAGKLPAITIERVYDKTVIPGQRILVDRLWPRGMSKEVLALDDWLKNAAPSPALRKWFGHQPERFAAFADRYRVELEARAPDVVTLLGLVRRDDAILLYAAHDPACNHALVLRDWLKANRGT